MKQQMRFLVAGLVLVLASTAMAGLAQAATCSADVCPPGSNPFGMTYGEWSARWWQWAVQTPKQNNPLLDTTGAKCAVGQSGPVWFLAGTLGSGSVTRTCTVPAGKALFFPVVNAFCANNPGESATYNDELACAQAAMAGATGATEIDGTPVQPAGHLEQRYLFASPSFSLNLPPDNVFNARPGIYSPAAADGIYLMLAPLGSGQHVVHFKGSAAAASVEATYNLTVAG